MLLVVNTGDDDDYWRYDTATTNFDEKWGDEGSRDTRWNPEASSAASAASASASPSASASNLNHVPAAASRRIRFGSPEGTRFGGLEQLPATAGSAAEMPAEDRERDRRLTPEMDETRRRQLAPIDADFYDADNAADVAGRTAPGNEIEYRNADYYFDEKLTKGF